MTICEEERDGERKRKGVVSWICRVHCGAPVAVIHDVMLSLMTLCCLILLHI